jgi:hypothetical protein
VSMLKSIPVAQEPGAVALTALVPPIEQIFKQTLDLWNAMGDPAALTRITAAMVAAMIPPVIGAKVVGTVHYADGEPSIYVNAGWYNRTELVSLVNQFVQHFADHPLHAVPDAIVANHDRASAKRGRRVRA